MKIRGINDEISLSYFPGKTERAYLLDSQLSKDFDLITACGANSVRIHSSDPKQIIRSAKLALDKGLHVWLSPRFINDTEAVTLKKLKAVSGEAEKIRKNYGKKLETGRHRIPPFSFERIDLGEFL